MRAELLPGEAVRVEGVLSKRTDPDAEGTYRDALRWHLAGSADTPLVVRAESGARHLRVRGAMAVVLSIEFALAVACAIGIQRAVAFEHAVRPAEGVVQRLLDVGQTKSGERIVHIQVGFRGDDRLEHTCTPDRDVADTPIAQEGRSVAIDYLPSDPSECRISRPWDVGKGTTIFILSTAVFALMFGAAALIVRTQLHRPWFEQGSVTGKG